MTYIDRALLRGKPLSSQEIEAVRRLAMTRDDNFKHEAIALEMNLSPNTVKGHLTRASCKLDVYHSWTGLLLAALREGEVTLDELVAPAHVKGETMWP